jgi:hypothetical protein
VKGCERSESVPDSVDSGKANEQSRNDLENANWHCRTLANRGHDSPNPLERKQDMAVERFDVERFRNARNPLQDKPFDRLERASEVSGPNRCAVVNDCREHCSNPER